MKKSLLFVIILTALLVGCNARTNITSEPTSVPTDTPTPTLVPSPVTYADIRQYVDDDHGMVKAELRNSLSDNNVFKKPAFDVSFEIPFDKVYENLVINKINHELLKAYQMLQDKDFYPDMSGIRVIARKAESVEKTVVFYTTFFDEGILSVFFSVNYQFGCQLISDPTHSEYYNYHYIYPLTFNLESGEIVKLADLFYNDVVFADVLRQAAKYQIANGKLPNGMLDKTGNLKTFDDARLQEFVDKINNEQRFFINGDNAIVLIFEGSQQVGASGVNLVIDYELPIMQDTFFKNGTLHITHLDGKHLSDSTTDFRNIIVKDTSAEYLAQTEDYTDPANLTGYLAKDTTVRVISDKIQIGEFSKVFVDSSKDHPAFTDDELRSFFRDSNSQLYKNIAVLKFDSYCEKIVHLAQKTIGKYIVISTRTSNGYVELDETYTLFDKETKKPLNKCFHWDKVGDFFKEGVNINAFLKAEYKKTLLSSNLFTEEQIDNFIESLNMDATRFEIDKFSSELCLWVPVAKESWPQEPFTYENTGWAYGMYLDYSRVKVPISDLSKLIFE